MPTEESPTRKPLIRLAGELKTPPHSKEARVEAGELLRRVQEGEQLRMPHSRPMPSIGPRCHENRVRDENRIRSVIYRLDPEAVVIAGVSSNTTRATPKHDIDDCRRRLKIYDDAARKATEGTSNGK